MSKKAYELAWVTNGLPCPFDSESISIQELQLKGLFQTIFLEENRKYCRKP